LLLGIVILAGFINPRIQSAKEDQQIAPTGNMVEVNDHQMHVHTEGDGEETFVFMSGGGTSSPVLDFKSLYSLFSDTYEIVIVEKAGYGFSEVTETSRDLDTMLSETREALLKSGVKGPYILLPHSMSGIEALYWAQQYPDEVKAIVGLDMAVPAAYESYPINMSLVHLSAFAATTGLIRWIPGIAENDAIKHGRLTDEEEDLYHAVFYRRTMTENMVNEIKEIKANAKIVEENEMPDVPMLLFVSDGEGTGLDGESWREYQQVFTEEQVSAELIELDASHYIHNIEYEKIAEETEKFIENQTSLQ
jgi:pimeloyl-ACP methyl ester carboxylesterase